MKKYVSLTAWIWIVCLLLTGCHPAATEAPAATDNVPSKAAVTAADRYAYYNIDQTAYLLPVKEGASPLTVTTFANETDRDYSFRITPIVSDDGKYIVFAKNIVIDDTGRQVLSYSLYRKNLTTNDEKIVADNVCQFTLNSDGSIVTYIGADGYLYQWVDGKAPEQIALLQTVTSYEDAPMSGNGTASDQTRVSTASARVSKDGQRLLYKTESNNYYYMQRGKSPEHLFDTTYSASANVHAFDDTLKTIVYLTPDHILHLKTDEGDTVIAQNVDNISSPYADGSFYYTVMRTRVMKSEFFIDDISSSPVEEPVREDYKKYADYKAALKDYNTYNKLINRYREFQETPYTLSRTAYYYDGTRSIEAGSARGFVFSEKTPVMIGYGSPNVTVDVFEKIALSSGEQWVDGVVENYRDSEAGDEIYWFDKAQKTPVSSLSDAIRFGIDDDGKHITYAVDRDVLDDVKAKTYAALYDNGTVTNIRPLPESSTVLNILCDGTLLYKDDVSFYVNDTVVAGAVADEEVSRDKSKVMIIDPVDVGDVPAYGIYYYEANGEVITVTEKAYRQFLPVMADDGTILYMTINIADKTTALHIWKDGKEVSTVHLDSIVWNYNPQAGSASQKCVPEVRTQDISITRFWEAPQTES